MTEIAGFRTMDNQSVNQLMASKTRESLVAAARELLHKQGLHRTSLADISKSAGVPLGNVYYHFKTKESLVAAVIDGYAEALFKDFMRWEMSEAPAGRLKAFVRSARDTTELFARYGCPHGALCYELERDEDTLAKAASNLLKLQVDWCAEQFQQMGQADAGALAIDLVANLQGSYMLTNTYRSASLLKARLDRLEASIDALAKTAPAPAAGQSTWNRLVFAKPRSH
jgi:AcrR family transcriptional regulator